MWQMVQETVTKTFKSEDSAEIIASNNNNNNEKRKMNEVVKWKTAQGTDICVNSR